MNVVDSSGWLEYFADSENADFFTEAIEDPRTWLFQPSASTRCSSGYASGRGEGEALRAVALMQQGMRVM